MDDQQRLPGPGEVGESTTLAGRACRDMCTSKNRPAWDSPARFGTERGTGRKVIWCPCCLRELVPEEKVAESLTYQLRNIRPPNLNPALEGRSKRFIDTTCLYDVVVLKDLQEVR